MINVRIAYAEPRLGPVVQPRGLHQRGFMIVLADEAEHRALPAWVPEEPGVVEIPDLLNRPADDIWTTAGLPEELAVRLLGAADAAVTGVDIQPVTRDPDEVNPTTCATRVSLGTAHVTAPLDQGLTLALVSGAQLRADTALMDRLAVDVPADDPAAPFRPPRPPLPRGRVIVEVSTSKRRVLQVPGTAFPWGRPRFEPRNLDFAAGLAGWQLHGPDDYSALTEDGTAILASAVAEPSGRAILVQTIFADDFRGTGVTFRGEFRTEGIAGLILRIPMKGDPDSPQERLVTVTGAHDWTPGEIAMDVPEGADVIQFGLVLTGPGRVRLRNPELCPNLTTLSWSTWPMTVTRWRSGCWSSGTGPWSARGPPSSAPTRATPTTWCRRRSCERSSRWTGCGNPASSAPGWPGSPSTSVAGSSARIGQRCCRTGRSRCTRSPPTGCRRPTTSIARRPCAPRWRSFPRDSGRPS